MYMKYTSNFIICALLLVCLQRHNKYLFSDPSKYLHHFSVGLRKATLNQCIQLRETSRPLLHGCTEVLLTLLLVPEVLTKHVLGKHKVSAKQSKVRISVVYMCLFGYCFT